MLKFAWPWMLGILPVPLVLLYLANLLKSKISKPMPVITFPKLQHVAAVFNKPNNSNKDWLNWRSIILAIAWICLTICLMRPEMIQDIAFAKNTGYDLMLAVDLSPSMEMKDFVAKGSTLSQPISRIAATKKVVADFVEQRNGDRIGLIVFGEQAYLVVPLTLDSKAVVKLLNNLMVGMAGESTAIGDAIGIGLQSLRKRPLSSRVLILLTDGEDKASHIPPLEAAKIAAADHIKIYTIGVGDKLDDNLLKKIADVSGGSYFKATNLADLAAVYSQIDKLEKSEAKQQVLLIRKPLYHVFLLIAILCLAAVFSFNTLRYGLKYEFS